MFDNKIVFGKVIDMNEILNIKIGKQKIVITDRKIIIDKSQTTIGTLIGKCEGVTIIKLSSISGIIYNNYDLIYISASGFPSIKENKILEFKTLPNFIKTDSSYEENSYLKIVYEVLKDLI